MRQILRWIWALGVLVLFGVGCAQQVAPEGGPKDTAGPELVAAIPNNSSINFEDRLITLIFNEFIQVDESKIIISPPLPDPLKIKVRKKEVILELPDSLDDNTTYYIQFGSALKDLNEGNISSGVSYVFSTGPVIDSLSFTGVVINALSGAVMPDITAMLYKVRDDTCLLKCMPYYVAQTNDAGNFIFNNLKEGVYNLAAIDDKNNDYKLSSSEAYAFFDSSISIQKNAKPVSLILFSPQPILRAQEITTPHPGMIKIGFNRAVAGAEIQVEDKYEYLKAFNLGKDTLTYWFREGYGDSILFGLNAEFDKKTTFSVAVRPLEYRKDEEREVRLMTNISKDSILKLSDTLELTWIYPITEVNNNIIEVKNDSVLLEDIDVKLKGWNKLQIIHNWMPDSKYVVKLKEDAITDYYGEQNMEEEFTFQTDLEERYGSLILTADLTHNLSSSILQLVGGRDHKIIYSAALVPGEVNKIVIPHIPVGNYQAHIVLDKNKNGRWDPGDFEQKLQPEEIIRYVGVLEIKPKWEVEADFHINDTSPKSIKKK